MTERRDKPDRGDQSPLVPVSWGELIDKITILEIKCERFNSAAALHNVRAELSRLHDIAADLLASNVQVRAAAQELKQINNGIWDIEDRIRAKERDQRFDAEFIELARSVYRSNDGRSAVKRRINALTGSELVEEKQYTAYDRG
jgi:hypothetical protein